MTSLLKRSFNHLPRLRACRAVWGLALLLSTLPAPSALRVAGPLPPTELDGLAYTNEFFPGASYDAAIPTPETLLGFPAGQRAANSSEIERCLKAWSERSDRTRLVEYARSHGQRPLHYIVITSPANLARLEGIRGDAAKLGDPRHLSGEDAERLINSLPGIAWLGYTIHGDETEGSDAALAVLYHLIACTDPKIGKLLEDLVIIIDPLMNPDGRDRFLKMIAEHRGTMPNVDDQSLLHEGYWPWGRGNHYYFDLNRDWILGVHPETQGRIREVAKWNPLLFVDAHGMGAQDTHLFSPPREPINPYFPKDRARWNQRFAEDQAKAFDAHHLVYYHGEWNEEWYPGYSDSWASFRGATGILYEQARIAEDGVRRPEGRILSYRESVHHHVIGSMANLFTLQAHARERWRSFWEGRREAVDKTGPFANRTFAVLPTVNGSRLKKFTDLMRLQGFEVHETTSEFSAALASDRLGREHKARQIPAGTILLQNRQPLAHLLAATLEFDPRISTRALEEEREELLRNGGSRIYDSTAWNLTMLFGLEALVLHTELPASARLVEPELASSAALKPDATPLALILDGADDRSVAAAARLMERGIEARVAEKPFQFDQQGFARGSVVVTQLDNRRFQGDLAATVTKTAEELGLAVKLVVTGLGKGDLPDLGGRHFVRLEKPRIGVLSRGRVSNQEFGAIWFVLDHELGIRHSHLDESNPGDLSRYNVLILPSGSAAASSSRAAEIRTWVKGGGTLIAISGSAGDLATEKSELSKVRTLPDVLGKLAEYELAVFREWMARQVKLPDEAKLWAHVATPGVPYPWQDVDSAHPDEKELKRRDAWQALFMPQGALLAARVDSKHWLTFGTEEPLPVLVGRHPVLMAAEGVEAPVRYGMFVQGSGGQPARAPEEARSKTETSADKKEAARVGWAALPKGYELRLRMSGLLWPEASHRLANAAYLTREPAGRGQVILFATPPAFRGATRGTMRLLANALVYGPGFGAAQPILP